jgi:hypothetical protein
MIKTNLENNMEEILNLPQDSDPIVELPVTLDVPNAAADFETARENIHSIIQKGTGALDDIIILARASDSARAYEVVSQMIKTLVDANKDLIHLHKQLKDVEDNKGGDTNIQNNLFVGNTAELQKLINNRNKLNVQ